MPDVREVWKCPLTLDDRQEITLPEGAQFLTAATQYNVPTIWALVLPENARRSYTIRMIGTGIAFSDPDDHRYVGTSILHGGALVLHVYVRWNIWREQR